MNIFIDSAILDGIRRTKVWNLLDKVTRNPSLLKKTTYNPDKGKSIGAHLKDILKTARGAPFSLEFAGTDCEEMVKEGKILHKKFKEES